MLMTNLLKEVKIHSSCSHENIIKLYTTTEDEGYVYLILEYAAAGELFDRIAPDVGIGEDLAHFYFSQLLNGMVCSRTFSKNASHCVSTRITSMNVGLPTEI